MNYCRLCGKPESEIRSLTDTCEHELRDVDYPERIIGDVQGGASRGPRDGRSEPPMT